MSGQALTPAADMPWPVSSPFRMRPGLSKLGAAQDRMPDLFLRDGQAAAYADHKRRVLDAVPARGLIGEADPAVLQAMADAYAEQTGVRLAPDA